MTTNRNIIYQLEDGNKRAKMRRRGHTEQASVNHGKAIVHYFNPSANVFIKEYTWKSNTMQQITLPRLQNDGNITTTTKKTAWFQLISTNSLILKKELLTMVR